MATYVNDLRLKEIATGDESGTWGTSTNTNLELIGEAFSFGTEAISTNADTHTTTIADGSTDPGRSIYLQYTGALDSDCTVTIGPNTVSKLWFIENATTDSGSSGPYNIIIKQGSGATVTVPNGNVKAIYSDGAGSGGKMVDAFKDLSVGGSFLVTTSSQDTGITVECTNGGGSAGPSLKLDRNSASPADSDDIGEIEFSGRNDAAATKQFARIASNIVDASDGTEDGSIEISAQLNGTQRSRFLSNATETVFNDASQDLDFRVETDTDANALFVQGSTNRVMLGFNANVAVANINPHLSVVGTDNGSTAIGIARYSADVSGPRFVLSKSRNGSITTAGGTVVQSGDTTGLIQFSGDDGSDMASRTARIQSQVAATPGSDDMPGLLQFFTTADGSASETERMRITEGGDLLYNTTTDYGGKVNIKADASGSSESALALVSTLASAADGPILDLNRQTASPADNDNTGLIRFKSTNSAAETVAYAEIDTFTQDVTDGTEDGMIRIRTILNGTLRSRIEFDQTETVINEDSVDVDFRVESNGSTKKFFVDGGENVVCINTDSPRGIASTTSRQFQMEGTSGTSSSFSITRNQGSSGGPGIFFGKTRGSAFGDNTIVQDGDILGSIGFAAADGTDVAHQAASIAAEVDGTPGANDVPGRIVFKTTPDGSTTLNERMRINAQGDLLFNTTVDYGGTINIARGTNDEVAYFVSTDADSSTGPVVTLLRASASPADNDVAGRLSFSAYNSAGADARFGKIQLVLTDVTDGTEDGRLEFEVIEDGAERSGMTLGASGAVFNEDSRGEFDFRVESNANTHMLFVDSGTNTVRIGSVTQISTSTTTLQVTADSGERAADVYRPTSTGTGVIFAAFSDVGGTATKVFEVEANGDVENATGSYSTISDQRLKQDIVDANSQWNDIKALQIRNFKFINDVNQNGEDALTHIGVVAQEVESAGMTGLVKTRNDEDTGEEIKSVKSSVIYMKAVKALQEAITRIETLEAEVTALKGGG